MPSARQPTSAARQKLTAVEMLRHLSTRENARVTTTNTSIKCTRVCWRVVLCNDAEIILTNISKDPTLSELAAMVSTSRTIPTFLHLRAFMAWGWENSYWPAALISWLTLSLRKKTFMHTSSTSSILLSLPFLYISSSFTFLLKSLPASNPKHYTPFFSTSFKRRKTASIPRQNSLTQALCQVVLFTNLQVAVPVWWSYIHVSEWHQDLSWKRPTPWHHPKTFPLQFLATIVL